MIGGKFPLIFVLVVILFQNFTPAYSAATEVPFDNICLGCICEAASECNKTLTYCDGDVCGMFKITKAYWIDAKRPVVAGDDPKTDEAYRKCTLDEVCAGTTVSQYVTNFAQDCNEDGRIDCYDYAAIHQRGGYGGCKAQPLTGEYLKRFSQCFQYNIKQQGSSTQF